MMSAGPTPQNTKLHQDISSPGQVESLYSACPGHDSHNSDVLRLSPPPTPNPNCYNDTFSGLPPEWSVIGDSTDLNDAQGRPNMKHTAQMNPTKSAFDSSYRKWNADSIADSQVVSMLVQSPLCEHKRDCPEICSAPYLAPLESGVFPDNYIDPLTTESPGEWQEHFVGPTATLKSSLSTTRARAKQHSQETDNLPTAMPSQPGLQGLGLSTQDARPAITSGQADQIINRLDSISLEPTRSVRKAFGPVDQRQSNNPRSNHSKPNSGITAGKVKQSNLPSKSSTKYPSHYEERSAIPNKLLHGRNTSVPAHKPRTMVSAPRPTHDLSEATSDLPIHVLKYKPSKTQSPSVHLR